MPTALMNLTAGIALALRQKAGTDCKPEELEMDTIDVESKDETLRKIVENCGGQ